MIEYRKNTSRRILYMLYVIGIALLIGFTFTEVNDNRFPEIKTSYQQAQNLEQNTYIWLLIIGIAFLVIVGI